MHRTWNIMRSNMNLLCTCKLTAGLEKTQLSTVKSSADCFWFLYRGMAGHSKWQNIRHTKGAKDAEKSRHSIAINRKIKLAVKEGGSVDPKLNYLLARIIEEANRLDIPKVNVQNAIKQCEKQQKEGKPLTVECRGPGNCMLIVECLSASPKATRNNMAAVLNKVGGSLLEKGIALHCFVQKGVIKVPLPTDSAVDQDKAEDLAIEVDAEDVSFAVDENREKSLQFICGTETLKAVKENLSNIGYNPTPSLEYRPTVFATLNEQELKRLDFMFEKFEELDDIIKIYDNVEISS